MYKQFLDYQNANVNVNEIFARMVENLQAVVESLKESFSSRGVTTQNIYVDTDPQNSVVTVNILWHKMSFTTRCNFQPQALYRADGQALFSSRIMAVKGNYYEMMKGVVDHDEEMVKLLDNEVASLFIPPQNTQNCVMKMRHITTREFGLNQTDAPREFVLKVIEAVCGGGFYHEEGARKSFNI
jgi:hypothetical protein